MTSTIHVFDGETDFLADALRERDERLAFAVGRALHAYLELLPEDGAWVDITRHQEMLDNIRPALGYRALSFAIDRMLEDRAIDLDGASGYVRRRARARRSR